MQTGIAEPIISTQVCCPTCGHDGGEKLLRAPDRYHGRQTPYLLLRCPSCTLVWLHNPPRPDEMGQHYGPDYDRSVAAAGRSPDRWRGRVDALAQYKTGGSILDLGCSSGGFLGSLKNPAWKLYGIEMSDEVARKAEEDTGAEVFVGDILDAPYRAGSFDAITCFHVFEHLYQPREILAKVSYWLKPGGIFYAMMPNIDSAGARIFKSYWYALELPRHLYHFSPVSLKNAARSAGLLEHSVTTHREVFIEQSTRYIVDEMYRRMGFPRVPLSKSLHRSYPRRAMRKAFRLTILPVLTGLASFAGDGESIHAVFVKPGL
jgi:2-polyprenyl-3-methyl-5-hydroxy-6-metoxy-1,4-benzoquinol methylase